jgi:hypothetical protein
MTMKTACVAKARVAIDFHIITLLADGGRVARKYTVQAVARRNES